MTENTFFTPRPGMPTEQHVSWPLVLGLGSLALLWPLAHLTGLSDGIGQLPTVLTLAAVVAVVWIGSIGLGRVPRPVLTLTLAGAVYGAFLVVLSRVFGMRPEVDGIVAALVAAFELGRSTLLGFLAGLAVRNLAGRR